MPTLTGIDITGIQSYVFGSNRLRDVLAASWMVDRVTSPESLKQFGEFEILLAGGGNAILLFAGGVDVSKTWTSCYSRWVLEEAPGLDLVIRHRAYDSGSLAQALLGLQQDLARAKLERRPHIPQLGLSVTAPCMLTGLPATEILEGQPVSSRIGRLRTHLDEARQRWESFLPELPNARSWNAEFPDQLDLMGRSHGDTSLTGIVHVDGNGVGRLIHDWLTRCSENNETDDTVRDQYAAWSGRISEIGDSVLMALSNRIAARVNEPTLNQKRCFLDGMPFELGFPLHDWRDDTTRSKSDNRRSVFLPLRPILLGGDDLTFVCDGRIALDLASVALRTFAASEVSFLGENGSRKLSACAGVALVRSHAPFYRSYELAAGLCGNAKQERAHRERDGSWMDWHIGVPRPGESIRDIRTRQYDDGKLTMRPYPIEKMRSDQTWDWLHEQVLGPDANHRDSFRGFSMSDAGAEPNHWSGSRGRVKQLRSLLVHGRDAVERQMNSWAKTEPAVRMPGNIPKSGFIETRTPLLDAIELLDLHLRLDPESPDSGDLHGNGD